MVVAFKVIILMFIVTYLMIGMADRTKDKLFYFTAAMTMAIAFIVAQIAL